MPKAGRRFLSPDALVRRPRDEVARLTLGPGLRPEYSLLAMTTLLEKAFQEAAHLPSEEQDALARWLLAELRSEHRWQEAFASSHDALAHLAEEALADDRDGRTRKLDPDDL